MENYIKINNTIIKNISSFRFNEEDKKDLSTYFKNHKQHPLVCVDGQFNFVFLCVDLEDNTMNFTEFSNKQGFIEFVEVLMCFGLSSVPSDLFQDENVKNEFYIALREIKLLEEMKRQKEEADAK